jgi:hypothetical protein
MDHNLLMMLYGALIGVGSSIITSLFQSWLEALEYERRKKKEEQEKKKRSIYVPTSDEVKIIIEQHFKNSSSSKQYALKSENSFKSWISALLFQKEARFVLVALVVVITVGTIYLLYLADNPILFLIVTAFVTFVFATIIIKWRIS